MCIARHAQSTQNNKFIISLQYLKENMRDEVNLLPADKRQRFPQSDTIILVCVCVWSDIPILPKIKSLLFLCNILRKKWVISMCRQINMKACYKLILWFWWRSSSIPKVPKIANLQCLYNISEKTLQIKLICCMQIKTKVFDKLISTLWASKFPTRWCYHYWWAWSSILKVLKVTTFQYLYNVSTKKLGMEFICIFCMQINIKASRSWHYRFWWKWPDLSKVSKIGSW